MGVENVRRPAFCERGSGRRNRVRQGRYGPWMKFVPLRPVHTIRPLAAWAAAATRANGVIEVRRMGLEDRRRCPSTPMPANPASIAALTVAAYVFRAYCRKAVLEITVHPGISGRPRSEALACARCFVDTDCVAPRRGGPSVAANAADDVGQRSESLPS